MPVTLRFSTTEIVEDGMRSDLLRNFIVVQPARFGAIIR